jgi:uncharacterized phage-associated protein
LLITNLPPPYVRDKAAFPFPKLTIHLTFEHKILIFIYLREVVMYSSDKILQEIIYLLSLNDNKMSLLKLMKELYLIDRKSIEDRDTSVSGDVFYSMPHGPVLSQTLNMLNDLSHNNWGDYLSAEPARYYNDIKITKDIEFDRLSKKDRAYIQEISNKFKTYTPKELEEYTHTLPEWVDPKRSSLKIRYRDVMLALGKNESEIAEAKKEYEALSELSKLSRSGA